jgi:hypothetical protein
MNPKLSCKESVEFLFEGHTATTKASQGECIPDVSIRCFHNIIEKTIQSDVPVDIRAKELAMGMVSIQLLLLNGSPVDPKAIEEIKKLRKDFTEEAKRTFSRIYL